MPNVTLDIGDQQYFVACREGGEARLKQAGVMIAERWADAERAAGNGGTFRAMLFAALMLADQLIDVDIQGAKTAVSDPPNDASLDWIADRLVALADALETSVPNA